MFREGFEKVAFFGKMLGKLTGAAKAAVKTPSRTFSAAAVRPPMPEVAKTLSQQSANPSGFRRAIGAPESDMLMRGRLRRGAKYAEM